jgi:hypothetical protein
VVQGHGAIEEVGVRQSCKGGAYIGAGERNFNLIPSIQPLLGNHICYCTM